MAGLLPPELCGLLLLSLGVALLVPLFRREKAPRGEGVYSVNRQNYFPSSSGSAPCRTRLYPTDLAGALRQAPADREIRRKETLRQEESS